ncbi:MAG: hypothetical protein IPK07_25415 [Deltaproteobacteria bacterium]|nr:hypothetical protein [Deltaproteobacteria bacterium]
MLDDRLAFLGRIGRADEQRKLLAEAADRAASGHRESLLERLASACLDARDLPCAARAAQRLVESAPEDLDEGRRLAAFASLAGARFAAEPGLDALALVNSVAGRFQPETLPDVYGTGARAADAQGAFDQSVTLWIEALNRRTDRAWIREAMRGAERAGAADRLLAFFEKQRARSPRDVRWAIVVRELRLANRDLAGAIEVSKAAVQVRPEKRELWTETADLLERDGRPQEAADYLDGRDKLEPGNEDIARRRGQLYARAASLAGTPAAVAAAGQRIVAVERAALDSFKKKAPMDDDRKLELVRREGRAARRLLEYGYPQLAWSFLAGPADKVAAVRASDLGTYEQAQLALRAGKIVKLVNEPNLDADSREAIGRAVGSYARPEQKQEILSWLAARPLAVKAGALGPEGQRTVDRWWSMSREAGLEDALRMTLARKGAASVPGPWAPAGGTPPFSFLTLYAEHIAISGSSPVRTELPSADETWVEDLVARDRPVELAEFLAPRVRALMAQVRGATPLPGGDHRLDWTSWVDGVTVFDTWCRGLEARPELLHELEDAFTDSGRWGRFLVLGGRHWPWRKLVELLPGEARDEWFAVMGNFGPGWTEEGAPDAVDPATRRAVAQALGGLVSGATGGETSPLLAKLRGPQTVGEVLGHDPRFDWTAPPAAAAGVTVRADTARFPRDLWGDRPGEAWYALESLARLRARDARSWRVPLEVAERGAETERKRVARAMALTTAGPAEALAVDAAHRVGGGDLADLGWRARTLVAAGKPDEASRVIEAEVAKQQPRLRPEGFRQFRRLAADLALPDPIQALDTSKPVGPALLAYLVDAVELGAVTRFRPADAYDFRSALHARWRDRDGALAKEQVVLWLDELWAHGSGSLPRDGLRTLGGLWPAAADWLGAQPETARVAALAAVRALPADTAPLVALFPGPPAQRDEVTRLLWMRVCLARGEGAAALEQYGAVLREVASGAAAPTVSSSSSDESDDEGDYEEGDEGSDESSDESYEDDSSENGSESVDTASMSGDDSSVTRLRRWLDAFRDAKKAGGADVLVEAEARTLALLLDRESHDKGVAADWPLALELAADDAARANVLARLEGAWIRGDVAATDLGPIVATLARFAPHEAPRWLARWPLGFDEPSAQDRAQLVARLGDRPAADALLTSARERGLWSGPDEVRAFDAWRGLPPEKACDKKSGATCPPPAASRVPKAWTAAAAFWREPASKVGADLARHLDANPLDLLAARAALRTIVPLDAETAARATRTLRDRTMQSFDTAGTDTDLLRLRAMRGLLASSWRAADSVMTYVDPGVLVADLTRRRQRKTEIDASVADLARLHAAAGDDSATDLAMQVLEERDAALAVKVRAALAEARVRTAPLPTYRLQNAVPRPYRPRDLDWAVVNLVATEAPR